MGWVGKQPGPEQQRELGEFADSLNAAHEACKRAIDDFELNTNALYHICFRASTEDRRLQELEYLQVATDSQRRLFGELALRGLDCQLKFLPPLIRPSGQ